MSVRAGVIAAAGFLAAVAGVLVQYRSEDDPKLALILLTAAAGLAFVVVGQVASWRRPASRVGLLMTVTGFLYLLPAVVDFDFEASRVAAWLYLPVLAHLFLSFPSGRLRSRFDRALVAAVYMFAPAGALISTALFDRGDGRGLSVAVDVALQAVGGLLALLVAVAVAIHWRGASRRERRSVAPLIWVAGINVAVFVTLTVAEVADPDRALPPALEAIRAAALLLMPAAFLVGLLRSRLARVAVGDLVMELCASGDLSRLRESTARALGDPSVDLLRWNTRAGGYADGSGRLVDLPADGARAVTLVASDDGPVAALVHDPSLREEPQLVQAVAGAARLALENRQLREEISLSRKVTPGLAEHLRREGRPVGETEALEVTVLMSDVRGYSTIAERADPHVLVRQLDEHRKEMSRLIAERGGTVMQFIGDAVFAVFGAPLPKDDHAGSALDAARAMHAAQAAVNERWAADGLPRFDMGIGLSTGTVAAALLGSDEHMEYSAVGDTVNLAQRLQQWAARGETVLSEPTHAAVDGGLEAEPIEPATVKGREALVVAHRLRS